MPHVVVKMHSGRTDEQKQALADALAEAVKQVLGSSDASVSVGVEDVEKEMWADLVVKPDILARKSTIYKMPGYPIA